MRSALWGIVLLLLAGSGTLAWGDIHRSTGSGSMQGRWKLVKFQQRLGSGIQTDLTDRARGEMTVEGTAIRLKVQIDEREQQLEYTFREIPDTSPVEVDYRMPDNTVIRGIYFSDGQTMVRCNSDVGETRPRDFLKGTFSVWKRQQP